MDPALDPPLTRSWTVWHDRLHRELLQDPQLLPAGEPLLLAVSGGQDSMALTALLLGLRRLHHWEIRLWHGDHGWHPGSAAIAAELQAWSLEQGLPITVDRNSSNNDQLGKPAERRPTAATGATPSWHAARLLWGAEWCLCHRHRQGRNPAAASQRDHLAGLAACAENAFLMQSNTPRCIWCILPD